MALSTTPPRAFSRSAAPGTKSTMHSHPDAMLVPLGAAKVRFTLADGKTQDMEVVKETAAYTPAGTHDPTNVGTTPVDALLVEFKAKTPGTATLPSARPGMQTTTLAESPRAVAIKTTAAPDFHEPGLVPSTTRSGRGDAGMSLAVDGSAPVTKWQRGDVQFIGRGVKHESKNTSGKPVEFIIVMVK
jgi:oxalate decarboxylase/phosphoglucose isomerase-like protein (cupin superfamily)